MKRIVCMMQIFAQMRFLHALETDIRNENVRNHLAPLFKNPTITNEERFECVIFAISNESERLSNKKEGETSISPIEEQQQKGNPFHLPIKELKLDHNKQLQAIHSEI